MTLVAFYPWIVATALALGAGLCGQLSSYAGAMTDMLELYRLDRPPSPLHALYPRWQFLRRSWLMLAGVFAVAALCFVAIGLGLADG